MDIYSYRIDEIKYSENYIKQAIEDYATRHPGKTASYASSLYIADSPGAMYMIQTNVGESNICIDETGSIQYDNIKITGVKRIGSIVDLNTIESFTTLEGYKIGVGIDGRYNEPDSLGNYTREYYNNEKDNSIYINRIITVVIGETEEVEYV